jgi:hypothetical protein
MIIILTCLKIVVAQAFEVTYEIDFEQLHLFWEKAQ